MRNEEENNNVRKIIESSIVELSNPGEYDINDLITLIKTEEELYNSINYESKRGAFEIGSAVSILALVSLNIIPSTEFFMLMYGAVCGIALFDAFGNVISTLGAEITIKEVIAMIDEGMHELGLDFISYQDDDGEIVTYYRKDFEFHADEKGQMRIRSK